jgi:hypothetical protein
MVQEESEMVEAWELREFARGNLAPGMFTGICADTGGGFGELLSNSEIHSTDIVNSPGFRGEKLEDLAPKDIIIWIRVPSYDLQSSVLVNPRNLDQCSCDTVR